MRTIQIESLWQYIQSLSLSKKNKKWLADRLLKSNASENESSQITLKAIKEAKEGQVTSFNSLDDFKKHMYEL